MSTKQFLKKKIDEIADFIKYRFNIFFKGDDWEKTQKWQNLKKEFKKKGVSVIFFPYTKTTSSTLIKKTLEKKQ